MPGFCFDVLTITLWGPHRILSHLRQNQLMLLRTLTGDVKRAKRAYLEFLLTKPVCIFLLRQLKKQHMQSTPRIKVLVVTTYAAEHNTGVTDDKTCTRSYLSCGSKTKATSSIHGKDVTT